MSTHIFTVEKGATDVSFELFAQNSTDGTALTGLVYNAAGLTAYYKKGTTGAITQITLATQTATGAHSDGGLVLLSDTSYEGVIRFDPLDTIFATGNDRASIVIRGATNLQPIVINIDLVDSINVNGGVIEANVEQWLDTAVATPTTAGVPEVDVTFTEGTATGIITGSAVTGTLSTTVATSDLTGFADDQLIGRTIIFTSGAADGEATDITDYASTNGTLTFTALTTAPGNTDTFKIV